MFSRRFISNRNEKNKRMNKPRDLVLSILETSKTLMYEFWCDYIKPKFLQNAKLCYMDSIFYCFIIHIKTKEVIRTLQMMLKKDLIQQTMQSKDHCQYEKTKVAY